MFKFMKQGISLAAAVAAAGSCIPVYAAGIQPRTSIQAPDGPVDTETGNGEEASGTSITIAEPVEGHRYKVYQVFKGKVSSDGTKLSNVEYGANYSGREGVALKDELAHLEAEGAEAKAFAETVRELLKGEPAAVLSAENPTAELEAGYYMILDETLYEIDGDSLSDYIVTVAGNVTVQPKSVGVPGFDKTIDDNPGGTDTPEPDEPDAPPADVPENADISPETADIDWNYTLHEDTGVITLNYYDGEKANVKVYSHYRVPGSDRVYKAELANGIETLNAYNSKYMFYGNDTIESVVFSDNLDTSTCTDMGNMFANCSKLASIDFGSGFNTANVKDMSDMFAWSPALQKLDVSIFDTSSVTDMRGMFNACESLTSLDLGNFDTSSVTTMLSMFFYCRNLSFLDISSFDTSSVNDMTQMFDGCFVLNEIDVSNFNTENVTKMNRMFARCKAVDEIILGNKFVTSSVEGMNSMFWQCTSLENMDLTGFDTNKCSDMRLMFKECTNLKNIMVTDGMWVTDQANITNMFQSCGINNVTYISLNPAVSAILPLSYASDNTGDVQSEEFIEIENDDTSVEYGIGDSIPYKLTATMPESITAYNKYVLAFHDRLSAGLDYDRDSLKVFAGDTEIPAEHYTVTYSEDGKSMTVSIADVKAAPWNAVPGTKIIVKYSAVLNENAQAGNTNEAFLEYSNDPKGDGTGTTGPGVPDTVTVYTFELRFDKVDKNGNALEGAGFTLYKKNDAGEFVPAGDEIKGLTRFSFKGLAAGEYKLAETTTPDGYNTMEDLYFNIVTEEAESGGETVKRISIEAPDGSPLSGWTAISADKAFESDIANYTGSTLPETGGAGTYLLYAAGVAVVITAGTVIAARKKADEE